MAQDFIWPFTSTKVHATQVFIKWRSLTATETNTYEKQWRHFTCHRTANIVSISLRSHYQMQKCKILWNVWIMFLFYQPHSTFFTTFCHLVYAWWLFVLMFFSGCYLFCFTLKLNFSCKPALFVFALLVCFLSQCLFVQDGSTPTCPS